MKLVISGGGGFIGHATKLFAEEQGHEVWTFDRSDGHDILGDLDGLTGADTVIHLAGLLGTHELFTAVCELTDRRAKRLHVIGMRVQ